MTKHDECNAALGVLSAIVDKTNWQPDLDAGAEALATLTEELSDKRCANDLLEALQGVLGDDMGSRLFSSGEISINAIRKARAAIAKATGHD